MDLLKAPDSRAGQINAYYFLPSAQLHWSNAAVTMLIDPVPLYNRSSDVNYLCMNANCMSHVYRTKFYKYGPYWNGYTGNKSFGEKNCVIYGEVS